MKYQPFFLTVSILLSSVAVGKTCGNAAGFRIFDATGYIDKPDLSVYGIEYLPIISSFWRPKPPADDSPSLAAVRRAIEVDKVRPNGHKELFIDVEHWPLKGTINQVSESITKYNDVIRKVRHELPDARLGLYGIIPVRDYWRAIKPEDSAKFRGWREENDRLNILVSEVDFLLPSLYTFYADSDNWEKYAVSNLSEARRISQGKPVYAFLWPQYHDSNHTLNSQYIPRKFWRKQLEIVQKYADGVVIWGGWDFRGKLHKLRWEDDMEWWQETLDWLGCDSKK